MKNIDKYISLGALAISLAVLTPNSAHAQDSAMQEDSPTENVDNDNLETAETTIAQLKEGFLQPPADTRPWTWFHVMSGNMSHAGITKDLESLAEVGVGGIVLFHVTQGIPIGPVRFNSPEHLDLLAHIAAECERLGLAFNFHNSDGWSQSGGPWVTPEQSMKRLVWSETLVKGGAINLTLAQPIARAGLYQDVAVIAYPTIAAEKIDEALRPIITASDPAFNTAMVSDGNRDTKAILTAKKDAPAWLQYSYDKPVTISSLLLENSDKNDMKATLEISQDGQKWQSIKAIETRHIGKAEFVLDDSFAPVTAQYFRIILPVGAEFGELALSALQRVPNVVAHTSMSKLNGSDFPLSFNIPDANIIDQNQIIDLTPSLDSKGNINSKLPSGEWTIMRFGFTSTGAVNVNPSPEGSGLEIDKFSSSAFMAHYDAFIGPVLDRARAVAPNATRGVMLDSYEVGGQNWTDDYEILFEKKFGQSIIPWLPIYTGRLVSDGPQTRDMLAKIRQFNANLMRDNYYGTFANVLKQQGLDSLVEPYGGAIFNEIDVGSTASIPTGEFWMGSENTQLNRAISPGRIYNSKFIAAEAFTDFGTINWKFSPVLAKKWGDKAWTEGINQFMFHRFAHQANTHVMPGMTMNRWGSHFDRTHPWWDEGGKAWFEYMARGHYLLRQGLPMAEIALYAGEDSPVTCPSKQRYANQLPIGVEYDCLNAETLLFRSHFVDGKLELPNGARYSMIWWPQNRAPSAAAMARMNEARAAGVPVAMEHIGEDAKAIFAKAGLSPRIISDGPLPMFTQRRVGDSDVFFLLNFTEEAVDYDLSFDARGNAPENWDPITRSIAPMSAEKDANGRTKVKIKLLAGQSTFLLFNPAHKFMQPLSTNKLSEQILDAPWSINFDPVYSDIGTISIAKLIDLRTSDNDDIRHFSGKATYRTNFNWAGETNNNKIMLDLGQVEVAATVRLNGVDLGTIWTHPYSVDISKAVRKGDNDLEITVANLWVNRLIGDAALPDTSGFVKADWRPTNKMVDWYSANQPPPPGPRRTFSTQDFYKADDPLIASGLIGPVRIITSTAAE